MWLSVATLSCVDTGIALIAKLTIFCKLFGFVRFLKNSDALEFYHFENAEHVTLLLPFILYKTHPVL